MDIIRAILEYNDGDLWQTAEDIRYLNGKLKVNSLEDYWEEFCSENNLCPYCGSELELESHSEYVGEYEGIPTYKYVYEGFCVNCDRI